MMGLAAHLKKLRLESRMSQREVAEKVGIRQQSYWKYEMGQIEPEFEILVRLADLYSMSVDELLEFDIDDYDGY